MQRCESKSSINTSVSCVRSRCTAVKPIIALIADKLIVDISEGELPPLLDTMNAARSKRRDLHGRWCHVRSLTSPAA